MKKYFLLFLGVSILWTSCSKNDDTTTTPVETTEKPTEETPVVKSRADYPVQDFMWQAMNLYYFWQQDVTDLGDTRFSTVADYVEFLSTESNPEDFFYKICNRHKNIVGENTAIDRFSFLSENYKELVQAFSGVSRSDGVEYGLSLYGDQNDIFGFVRYIVPGSDAEGKDIKRGDIFIGVNGTNLNINNYQELLFGDITTYTLNLAKIENNTIIPTGEAISLTKEEDFAENPILISKIIEQNGNKIGYLMYNSFIANYDEQLNIAFGDMKAAGINELILDFRYNGGGRVSSAVQIASAVYGTETEDLFLKARYNTKIQSSLQTSDVETNFSDTTINGTTINELNLTKVYVITSSSTASASELVINGLEPYIDVVQVGTKTVGKNEFSVTMVDDPNREGGAFIYSPSRESFINPNNQWAIQPLLGRNENADGYSDYTNGLPPDYELKEDLTNLGILGDVQEPLLKLTLSVINGSGSKISFDPKYPLEPISSSAVLKATNNMMSMDGLLSPSFSKIKSTTNIK